MKSNHNSSVPSTTNSPHGFKCPLPAGFADLTPVSPEARKTRGFAGDQESYRNDDGRPGAKNNKPRRGINPNADMRL